MSFAIVAINSWFSLDIGLYWPTLENLSIKSLYSSEFILIFLPGYPRDGGYYGTRGGGWSVPRRDLPGDGQPKPHTAS